MAAMRATAGELAGPCALQQRRARQTDGGQLLRGTGRRLRRLAGGYAVGRGGAVGGRTG
jgi:hypothetical protein